MAVALALLLTLPTGVLLSLRVDCVTSGGVASGTLFTPIETLNAPYLGNGSVFANMATVAYQFESGGLGMISNPLPEPGPVADGIGYGGGSGLLASAGFIVMNWTMFRDRNATEWSPWGLGVPCTQAFVASAAVDRLGGSWYGLFEAHQIALPNNTTDVGEATQVDWPSYDWGSQGLVQFENGWPGGNGQTLTSCAQNATLATQGPVSIRIGLQLNGSGGRSFYSSGTLSWSEAGLGGPAVYYQFPRYSVFQVAQVEGGSGLGPYAFRYLGPAAAGSCP